MKVSEIFWIKDCATEELLEKIVASNSKCEKCIFNHNNICFFAYKCVTADFSYQKESDN